jgi:flagellar hook assembly protein FlgD
VRIKLYDVAGKEIALIKDEVQPQGRHQITIDADNMGGKELPSGIYFYYITANGEVYSNVMMVLH